MANLVSFIKALPSTALRMWSKTIKPLNPNDEKFNVRTRFKLALLSFTVLTIVFIISFREAVRSQDADRVDSFLNFAQHISYVLGAVVASYVGMESVFPSIGGYGWRGRNNWHNHSGRKDDGKNPVGPGEDDADVQ